jgi:DnaK suppressor protein
LKAKSPKKPREPVTSSGRKSEAAGRKSARGARTAARSTTKRSKPSQPPLVKAGRQTAKESRAPATAKAKDAKASRLARTVKAGGETGSGSEKGRAPKARKSRQSPAVLARIRQFLSEKKRALLAHLETELNELEKPEKRHRADLEEIASDTHDTDSLCEIMDIEHSQLGQINLALKKIDDGTYGVCEDCGEAIPPLRLEALPFASHCIECKRRAELEGELTSSAPDAALGS